MKNVLFTFVLAVSILLSGSVFTQSAIAAQDPVLDEVVVTASRIEEKKKHVTANITVITAEEIKQSPARDLGVNVEATRRWLFLLASLLTGLSVSVAGIIGFIGLVVPHFMRMLVGPDHRILLAGSFLAGAAFLILCDTLARTIISPLELPVGVVTGIIGGTVFVYALAKKRMVL